MRTFSSFTILCFLLLGTQGVVAKEPAIDGVKTPKAKTLRAKCRTSPLASGANFGTVSVDDCVFNNGIDQYEDLFLVSQGKLKTRGGNTMATFALEDQGFNWSFGLGAKSGAIFPDPVYAFRIGDAGVYDSNGFLLNTFSVIGSDPVYKMWVAGLDPTQLGGYTLTASAEPVSNTCAKNHRVYLQGDVSFTSSIANENSCRGVVEFGPNIGSPLNYQYWWVRLSAGETISMEVTGIEDSTVAVFVGDFSTGDFSLDLGDGAGDTDRQVTLTASHQTEIYVEVSSVPDVVSSYKVNFDGP